MYGSECIIGFNVRASVKSLKVVHEAEITHEGTIHKLFVTVCNVCIMCVTAYAQL